MSLLVPLGVRIGKSATITADVSDLQFGSTSPGGFGACTVDLHRPLQVTPAGVTPFQLLTVFDARNGATVYEGRLQGPGRSSGNDGQVWQLAAVGGSAHLQDDTRPYIVVDADPKNWDRIDATTAAADVQQLADTGAVAGSDTPALSLRIPQGTGVDGSIPSRCVAAHRGIAAAGQKITHVSFTFDMGLTSANITANLYAATEGVGAADIAWTATFNVAGGSVTRVVNSDWANGRNRPIIRFHYAGGAGAVNADTWWLQITDLVVRTQLMAADGTERLAGGTYTGTTVTVSDVVNDLLGRFLGQTIDGANARVDVTSFPIGHLTYPDGATPLKVHEDLILLEQAYTWHVWETNPDNGKFRYEWLEWPTTVRYQADITDGFQSPSSGNTVFNQARVRWHNRGTIRTSLRTLANPVLTGAGFDRTHFIDLGDEASTQASAHRAGDQFLTEHQDPTNAGRLVVTGPIVDYQLGRMVQPWELRAGNLVRVGGVDAYPDALNPDGRDGVTVFKIAAVSYVAADNAATLDLDAYAPSIARALAALGRQQPTRRR